MKAFSFCYNENHYGLRKLLESTKILGIKEHLFIDGKFPDYPDKLPFSTDGTLKVIGKYPHTKTIFNIYGFIAKFNLAMQYFADDEEPILFISCDEYLEGSTDGLVEWLENKEVQIPYTSHIHRCGRAEHDDGNQRGMVSKSRIFTDTEYINLKHAHFWYYWKDKPITAYRIDVFKNLVINHDDRCRNDIRNKKMEQYQDINKRNEKYNRSIVEPKGRTTV